MRKIDITKYGNMGKLPQKSAVTTSRAFRKVAARVFLTAVSILMIIGFIAVSALMVFIFSMKNEQMDYDLRKLKLSYTSFIYVNNSQGEPQQYLSLYSGENRVWVDYADIPQTMKDAMIAIEDKRFEEHKGVDWRRTLGAVTNLFSKGRNYGGSTITQQLIKNVTGENNVSLTRKVKEIFRAMNLEKKYSKDEILEAYLNVVNFGSGSNGVQAAANLYFNKDISECDIAECAAIAGITQNPSLYTPLVHPEQNKKRQQTVLNEMYNQGKITKAEYDQAMQESENMKFADSKTTNSQTATPVWDWYTDTMIKDVTEDLAVAYNVTESKARDMIYRDGLKIYSAVDPELQKIAENTMKNTKSLPKNKKIQVGYYAMDYSGRVLATVGARGEKTKNLLLNYATDTKRQPGSAIKPLVDYVPAMELGKITYSTQVLDAPLENWSNGKAGPRNFNNRYIGNTTVQYAVETSLNAPAARILKDITPIVGYNFLKDKLHFSSLVPSDETLAMSIGGMAGVTVKEVTAGFQMFANGGQYYKPYTYFYVEDHDGNVILDNRSNKGEQVISSANATVMHRLLDTVVTGSQGSGYSARISGWQVFGKTGTTNDQKDSWFVGGTPYALAGIWTGYKDAPVAMTNTEKKYAISIWKEVMQEYLKDKTTKKFEYNTSDVVSATYCKITGELARPGVCTQTATGWYSREQLAKMVTCDGNHAGAYSQVSSELPVNSGSSSVQPDPLAPNESSSTASGKPASKPASSRSAGNEQVQPDPNKTRQEYQHTDLPNAVG